MCGCVLGIKKKKRGVSEKSSKQKVKERERNNKTLLEILYKAYGR